jgi:Fe-S oxidoreductase
MVETILSPAQATYWLVSGKVLFALIPLIGIASFAYIIARRFMPLLHAAPDPRFDQIGTRLGRVLQLWLGQWKQPRYMLAGILHIQIFAGFLILSVRSVSLVILGAWDKFTMPGFSGALGNGYSLLKDYAATVVLLTVVVAAVRRLVFRPARYEVPPRYGKGHTAEAILVLGLIATLMVSESLFEASEAAFRSQQNEIGPYLAPLSLAWMFGQVLLPVPLRLLRNLHLGAYLLHDLTFFTFLCFLPLGKHFHVVTSLFNVFFAKLDRGSVKPVRWGVSDEHLDEIKSLGVKKFEDFTWKHMLDFYSCADCGRCSDHCPANAAGRPLSPRFLTIKAREYAFHHYPLWGRSKQSEPLIGGIYSEDEIWSCTTCGACEEECPLTNQYIDKIVDMRRGLVDDGNVPQSLQKPLRAIETRGNPYGKLDKKRAEWANGQFKGSCPVKILDGKHTADTLYFVDSITSYDERIKAIGRATARILAHTGADFGILGAAEKDSGHDVRRFGEETLFMALRDHNTEAIKASGARQIVTADPHAYNALKHDYEDLPPVQHISEVVANAVKAGKIDFNPVENSSDVYTYHDPCYLGRHNQLYDPPRDVLDAIPGLKRVEMSRCRDRSFCCGGGGLALFYEPKEDQRPGVLRVKMAAEAGANVIVTACPFCMVNIEDAIKVAGMEGKITAIDLAELVDKQIAHSAIESNADQPVGAGSPLSV